ncbi:MAG: VOC family protein [Glaciimonas sp.]|nr:VOC family protein [Glaciimonas sp.]
MANPFVHIELHTGDLAKAKAFYSQLFDWKLEDVATPENGVPYTMINVGSGTGGGMMANPAQHEPAHWQAFVGVDDIKASTEKARSLGATVVQEVMDIGDDGWISVIVDPTGARFALWQAKAGS